MMVRNSNFEGDIEDATPTSEFSGAEGEDGEDDEYNPDENMLPPMDWLGSTDSIDATPTSEFSGAEGNLETPTSEFSGAEDEDKTTLKIQTQNYLQWIGLRDQIQMKI